MALLTVQSETVHNQFPLLLLPMELVLEVLDALDFRTLLVCKEVGFKFVISCRFPPYVLLHFERFAASFKS